MKKVETVDVLNSLITINNDRIEGYETASKETEELALKNMFAQFISSSHKCKQELALVLESLGGEANGGTRTSGKIFREWMNVKAALTGKNRNAILDSCEFEEDKTQDAYDEGLEQGSEHLSLAQKIMIIAQKSLLKADHDHVRVMRRSMVSY